MSTRGKSTHGPLSFQCTLHVRGACLCLYTQRAARALARHFDEAFRPFDLTNGQFSLLMSLNRPSPPTMGDVATLLAMDRTTLTAALKPLERRGLVETAPDPKDKRARRLALTGAGLSLLGEAYPVWEAAHRDIGALFSEERLRDLRADLDRLTFALPDKQGKAP
jgi:DNA-binding MarR family transcriptional regulator